MMVPVEPVLKSDVTNTSNVISADIVSRLLLELMAFLFYSHVLSLKGGGLCTGEWKNWAKYIFLQNKFAKLLNCD